MALWIQNVTIDPRVSDDELSDYTVQINRDEPLARFKHRRVDGAAECLRAAAHAIDARNKEGGE